MDKVKQATFLNMYKNMFCSAKVTFTHLQASLQWQCWFKARLSCSPSPTCPIHYSLLLLMEKRIGHPGAQTQRDDECPRSIRGCFCQLIWHWTQIPPRSLKCHNAEHLRECWGNKWFTHDKIYDCNRFFVLFYWNFHCNLIFQMYLLQL